MNLPEDYQNKMQKMLGGDEYLQYLDSFNYSYGQTLRVNQLKRNRRILPPVPFGRTSFGVVQDFIRGRTEIIRPSVLLCRSVLFTGTECDGTCRFFTSRTRR